MRGAKGSYVRECRRSPFSCLLTQMTLEAIPPPPLGSETAFSRAVISRPTVWSLLLPEATLR